MATFPSAEFSHNSTTDELMNNCFTACSCEFQSTNLLIWTVDSTHKTL